MINLQDSSGLPLLLNTQDNSLQPAGDITFDRVERVKLENIRPVLLNRTLRYPIDVYTEYCDISLKEQQDKFRKNKLHYNITVLPAGLLGIEYNKTHIFAPDTDQNDITSIIDIIYGSGIILSQKVKEKGVFDFETDVTFAAMFNVKRHHRVPIPKKHMYTFVNPNSTPLIIGRLFEDDGKIDYRTLRKEQGMSYYFIRKNARREVVKNPHYKKTPYLKKIKSTSYARKYSLTSVKPIYTQFIRNERRFRKLLV